MLKIKYGFLYLIIITGFASSFLIGYSVATNSLLAKPDNTNTKQHKKHFPSVCRIYITPEGMIDISSPDGKVEAISANQNIIIDGLTNEEEK